MSLQIRRPRSAAPRGGTAMVEFAIVFPVFMLIMFGLFEFGRAFMVIELLNAACRMAAREGVTDGVTTAQIKEEMYDFLEVGGIDRSKVRVYVLDGSGFDDDPFGDLSVPDLMQDYPANEKDMANSRPRSLGIFRVEVDFNDVALITPIWLLDLTLSGQVVMRRE